MKRETALFIIPYIWAILFLVPIFGGRCPGGTDSYYNQESNQWACCVDITCDKGYQPMPCEKGNMTSSWCKKCDSNQTFSDRKMSLTDRTKCRNKKRCHHFFLKGDETTDAICHCPEKWHHLEDGAMCLPNRNCPKGWGQTHSGRCERCKHGLTFSNEKNNHQRCMPVRRCKEEYRCTIREANITSDAICTAKVISDIENCPKPGEITSTTVQPTPVAPDKTSVDPKSDVKDEDRSKGHEGSRPSPETKPPKTDNNGDIVIRVMVSLLAIAIFAILFVLAIKAFRKERYEMHLAIVEHLENVLVINRKQESIKVYEVVQDYLTDEKCRHWRSLGENLLGEKLSGIESELREELNDRGRMYTVLDNWRESCCSDGPNLRPLFDAMFSPKRNWWIPYSPLRSRIIAQCNLPIPREHNISCFRRLCRMEWLDCLSTCIRRHSHNHQSRSTSQHNADQSVPNSTDNSQYLLV
ncbi:uncharacterized protein LOC135492046 [Lineus longissimus]|uniref:uncharacterized protein LOC135492046 n=1 Tax=Lineus longissimus TaxID=88925 RepID=UPI002B4D4A99